MVNSRKTNRSTPEGMHNRNLRDPFWFYLTLFVLLGVLALRAWAAGDVERGHALAQTWCANCHAVEGGRSAQDSAPSFNSLAARGGAGQIATRRFLNAPHPPMPDFNLARSQIDDIAAYLDSLTPAKPR